MRKIAEEIMAHAIIFVFMGVLYLETLKFPEMNIGGNLGSAWWPQLVVGLGMALTLASAVVSVQKIRNDEIIKGKIRLVELKSLGLSASIFCIFLLVTPYIGFMLAMPILVFGFMYQLGARSMPILILIPLLSSPLFTLLFGRFMEVSLPRGVGILRVISFYIY